MSKDSSSKSQPPTKRMKLWNPAIDDSTDYNPKPPPPSLSSETSFLTNESSNALKILPTDFFAANTVPPFYNPYFHFAPLLANFQSPCPLPSLPSPPKKAANFYATPPRMPADQSPAVRSFNPIVASALGRPLDALNQNCCAMCGMTFRLTGDLVQHMRTNHRTGKNKRSSNKDDTKKIECESTTSCNLVCSICEEIFEDEHHLVRHAKAHRHE